MPSKSSVFAKARLPDVALENPVIRANSIPLLPYVPVERVDPVPDLAATPISCMLGVVVSRVAVGAVRICTGKIVPYISTKVASVHCPPMPLPTIW